MIEFDDALVTGGAGFIGSPLADRLIQDCEVMVYDDLSSGDSDHTSKEASVIQADDRDTQRLADDVAETILELKRKTNLATLGENGTAAIHRMFNWEIEATTFLDSV